MRKTKAEAQKTRDYLLKAALDTFYTRGVTRASLNEIAQAAGVTRGALYWHFKNKEDIFRVLFQSIFEDISQRLAHDIETRAADILESLEVSITETFRRLETDEILRKFCNILHTKCEYTEQNHDIVKIIRSYQDMWQAQLGAALGIAKEQGRLPENADIRMSVLYLMSSITGLMHIWLKMPEQFRVGETAASVVSATLSTIVHMPEKLKPA